MKLQVMLAPLVLAFLPAITAAQEVRTVYSPELEGGTVYVQDVLHVRFVGDHRMVKGEELRSAWVTLDNGKLRKVVVREARLPEQDERSWKLEHRSLVSRTAEKFPPVLVGAAPTR